MSKSLGETINNMMQENISKRVLILTNNMHIVGTIHEYIDGCKNCNDCLIALKDVKIARLEDLCTSTISDCECDMNAFVEYKWFNINVNSILGFSIIG